MFSRYEGSVLLRDIILSNTFVFRANTAQVDSLFSSQFNIYAFVNLNDL